MSDASRAHRPGRYPNKQFGGRFARAAAERAEGSEHCTGRACRCRRPRDRWRHCPSQRAARIGPLRFGNGDYFWINDLGPTMVKHPIKPELDGKDLRDIKDPTGKRLLVEFAEIVKRKGEGFVDYQWPKPGLDAPQPKLSFVAGFQPWNWVIGTGVYVDDLQAQVWARAQSIIMIAAAVVVSVGLVTLLLARRVSKALVTMTGALDRLSGGDFDMKLPGLDRHDELGDMARSIEQFRGRAAERARDELRQDEERRRATEEARAQMAANVENATKVAVGEVASGTDRMARNASMMRDTALTVERNSGSVAAAAEEALTNAQTVARASSQLPRRYRRSPIRWGRRVP
ncbi:cache domain-containing protein [Bradyrhizobium sp. 26S5]|uniref:cache domain-containing protein n=1 Tax=Bradyrhizobium sp. 26S5 TaxID=3139729 RepID=UPI0039C85C58